MGTYSILKVSAFAASLILTACMNNPTTNQKIYELESKVKDLERENEYIKSQAENKALSEEIKRLREELAQDREKGSSNQPVRNERSSSNRLNSSDSKFRNLVYEFVNSGKSIESDYQINILPKDDFPKVASLSAPGERAWGWVYLGEDGGKNEDKRLIQILQDQCSERLYGSPFFEPSEDGSFVVADEAYLCLNESRLPRIYRNLKVVWSSGTSIGMVEYRLFSLSNNEAKAAFLRNQQS